MSRGQRRRAREASAAPEAEEDARRIVDRTADAVCGLCGRAIPPGAKASRHHLVPKLKGGAHLPTVRLHQICHSAIHARWSEAELARRLADIQVLRAEPEMARFIEWVRTKPDDFHAPTRMTGERRDARRQR